ncbi:hypothetical protein DXO170_15525 [Xanthomonas oryzae pv. oryzae]|uniref:Uncharacterized protein n=1 Tax=Xanthomonas oryzae pv. oryzae TaxID=64187 RepID=A0A854CMT7_XANOO|nr:hypothetical protein ATY42_20415 [Xanthomonas oryzae pv. oryzae]AOS20695.1 hypothetical protein ATY46_20695 [Xanthomonas oryzae pv. oryzae]AOS24854.1 hypothetical protein ATY47_20620 [Xanthomonas oryzae pv. oryzae]AOS29027.1 hypothetical protein ATY48_20600 [Xanthomonas oryzae pv. oryzae]AOS33163.1 hypothetical protein ATY49_20505 [Xanthomonas oryzae pv. oryzae]
MSLFVERDFSVATNYPEVAKAFGQVAPGDTGAIAVEDSLDKQPVVLGGHADMTSSAEKQIADAIPLIVSKGVTTCHCRAIQEGATSIAYPSN